MVYWWKEYVKKIGRNEECSGRFNGFGPFLQWSLGKDVGDPTWQGPWEEPDWQSSEQQRLENCGILEDLSQTPSKCPWSIWPTPASHPAQLHHHWYPRQLLWWGLGMAPWPSFPGVWGFGTLWAHTPKERETDNNLMLMWDRERGRGKVQRGMKAGKYFCALPDPFLS